MLECNAFNGMGFDAQVRDSYMAHQEWREKTELQRLSHQQWVIMMMPVLLVIMAIIAVPMVCGGLIATLRHLLHLA